jgi:hypothetical protein
MNGFTFALNGRVIKLNLPACKPFVVVFFTGKCTVEVTYCTSIWEAMEVYRLDVFRFPRRKRYLLDAAGWLYHVQGDLLHRATRVNDDGKALSDKHQRQARAAMREVNIPRYEASAEFSGIDREIWYVTTTNAQSDYDVVRDRIQYECVKVARLDGNAPTAAKLETSIRKFLTRYGVERFFDLNSTAAEHALATAKMPVAAKYILYTIAQDVQGVVYYPDLAAGVCLSKIEAQELVNLLRKKRHSAAYAGVSGIASQLKPYVKDVLHKYHTLLENKIGETK